ncbi:MAG TPA: hypothetical protein HPP77_07325 [Candidatus Hydrogenedentes bacterium]|nr:hypothetical protein [Candidatus Hydrogenedentota bacterium]HIJ73945.1 hypothetical protein [Candidatus Hydrogenedentota bacterium]
MRTSGSLIAAEGTEANKGIQPTRKTAQLTPNVLNARLVRAAQEGGVAVLEI